jgi:ABC-type dipeptide/oligopeptide/nickel transport system permease subunit
MTHAATTADHHLRGAGTLRAGETARVDAGTKRVSSFWHYAPWLVRVILAVPTLLFIRIGEKFVIDPLQVAAGSDMELGSPAAVTDIRAFGAMFLAVAALTLLSIFSTRRLLAGLVLVAFVIGFVTAARVLGAVVDGAAPETVLKLGPEVVLLVASVIGVLIEMRRQRHLR